MTGECGPRLTWSRLGIGVSVGLVLFGAIDAALPHSTDPVARISGVGPHETPDSAIATAATPVVSVQNSAAQRVAEEFVEATDTTDPTHPEGDTAERAALAPALTVPRRVTWPEAWVAEDRRTTVVLDPPGPVVPVGVRPGCRGRHWPDGGDHRCRPDLGGAGRRAGHAAPHRPVGFTERLPLGGHRCRVRLMKQDRVETVSG